MAKATQLGNPAGGTQTQVSLALRTIHVTAGVSLSQAPGHMKGVRRGLDMSRSEVVEAGNEDYGLGRGPIRAEFSEQERYACAVERRLRRGWGSEAAWVHP